MAREAEQRKYHQNDWAKKKVLGLRTRRRGCGPYQTRDWSVGTQRKHQTAARTNSLSGPDDTCRPSEQTVPRYRASNQTSSKEPQARAGSAQPTGTDGRHTDRRTAGDTSCRHKRWCRAAYIHKNSTRRPGRGTDWRTSAPVGKAKNKKHERPQGATAGQPEQGRSEKPEQKTKKRKAKSKPRGGRKSTAVGLGLNRTYAHVAPSVL